MPSATETKEVKFDDDLLLLKKNRRFRRDPLHGLKDRVLKAIRVLMADDHPLVPDGLRLKLQPSGRNIE